MLEHQDYLENEHVFFFIIFEKKYFTPFNTFSNYQKTFRIWLVNEIHEIMEKLLNHTERVLLRLCLLLISNHGFHFNFSLLFCIFSLLQDFSSLKS